MGVRFEGLGQLASNAGRLRRGCGAFLRELAEELGVQMLENARRNSPVDEGELRDGWFLTCSGACATVENGAPHALPVEMGHRAADGSWVEGQYFHRQSEDELRKALPMIAGDAMERFIGEVSP